MGSITVFARSSQEFLFLVMDFFAWNSAHCVRTLLFRAKSDWHRASAGPPNSQTIRPLNLPRRASANGCLEEKRHTDIEKPHRKEELHLCGRRLDLQPGASMFSRDLRKSSFRFSCGGFLRVVNSAHGVRILLSFAQTGIVHLDASGTQSVDASGIQTAQGVF